MRSSVGAPIVAEDRLWGVVVASSTREALLPRDGETRVAQFTELVATAIANASGREALAASRAASWPRPTRRAGGSSATSTTGRSSS